MLCKIFTYFQTNYYEFCHSSPRFANCDSSNPWRGSAKFVVWFAKKLNHAVAGRFAVCQDTNRTVAVRCGLCEPPRFVELWSSLEALLSPHSHPVALRHRASVLAVLGIAVGREQAVHCHGGGTMALI